MYFALQGLASGTLLYVVFFEILQEHRSGLKQYLSILVGFVVMFGLQLLSKYKTCSPITFKFPRNANLYTADEARLRSENNEWPISAQPRSNIDHVQSNLVFLQTSHIQGVPFITNTLSNFVVFFGAETREIANRHRCLLKRRTK